MAKDVTIRVTGTNPDGTINVQMPDGGNPFMGGTQQTGLVLANQTAQPAVQTGGYRARIGNTEVLFATEADFLKADKAFREQVEVQNVPSFGGVSGGGSRGTAGWLRTGANAAEAVAGFLQGRNIRRKLDELQEVLDDQRTVAEELAQLANNTKYAELIPVLLKALKTERYATETSIALLEDQLTAVDIQTGAGVAKVVGELWDGSGGSGFGRGADTGSMLGVGAAGLGLGLLFANNRDDLRSRRR